MRNRLPIVMMLVMAVLQGTGLLHALHFATAHTGTNHHHDVSCSHALHASGQDDQHLHNSCIRSVTDAKRPHEHHNSSICNTCQMLSVLKAYGNHIDASYAFLHSAISNGRVLDDIVVSHDVLPCLCPRAPPAVA